MARFTRMEASQGETYSIAVNIELVVYINTRLILNGCLGKKFNLKPFCAYDGARHY